MSEPNYPPYDPADELTAAPMELPEAEAPKSPRQEMTPDEIAEAKRTGKLCYKPIVVEHEGKRYMRTHDDVVYEVGPGGTIRSVIPRTKMSKKARRKMRRELGV